jgi:hypothetical protein
MQQLTASVPMSRLGVVATLFVCAGTAAIGRYAGHNIRLAPRHSAALHPPTALEGVGFCLQTRHGCRAPARPVQLTIHAAGRSKRGIKRRLHRRHVIGNSIPNGTKSLTFMNCSGRRPRLLRSSSTARQALVVSPPMLLTASRAWPPSPTPTMISKRLTWPSDQAGRAP